MEIDSILDDDDLDIQILEVKNNKENAPVETKPIIKKSTLKTNPVEEHLLRQLHCVHNQIEQAKNNIELIEAVTETTLDNLTAQSSYREDVSSESDNDLYSSTGELYIKEKKNKFYKKRQVLLVQDLWQRVFDNKWIIGLLVESTTSCVLKDPTIYCSSVDNEDCHGVSIFWSLVDGTFWYPTEEIDSKEKVVGTVAFDLPSFDNKSELKMHGVVTCEFDNKTFQSKIFSITLSTEDMIDGSWHLNFCSASAESSILALKTISVDRLVILPVQPDSNTGKRLMRFLDKYEFKEVCKVCLVKKAGALQYCLLEVLPADDSDVRVLLSARSETQLSLLMTLMHKEFPEMLDIEKQELLEEAAEALREELQLYLTCNDPYQIKQARIKSDLLIP